MKKIDFERYYFETALEGLFGRKWDNTHVEQEIKRYMYVFITRNEKELEEFSDKLETVKKWLDIYNINFSGTKFYIVAHHDDDPEWKREVSFIIKKSDRVKEPFDAEKFCYALKMFFGDMVVLTHSSGEFNYTIELPDDFDSSKTGVHEIEKLLDFLDVQYSGTKIVTQDAMGVTKRIFVTVKAGQ